MSKGLYELTDVFDYVASDDYKERFVGEYLELSIRLEKLRRIISQYERGTLDFTPTCSIGLLIQQANAMEEYQVILEQRAVLEGIDLDV